MTHHPSVAARPDHEGVFRFPDEKSARAWFEQIRWRAGRVCPSCFSLDTQPVPQATPMPYRCVECRTYFSVRIGTVMQSSRLPLRTWADSLVLMTTHPRGVSLRQLHRALGMAQSSAWRVGRQIRTAWQAYVALVDKPGTGTDQTAGVPDLPSDPHVLARALFWPHDGKRVA